MRRGLSWAYLPTLFVSLILTILGDKDNLVSNGDFESELNTLTFNSMMEVSASGLNAEIPMWYVVHGGVQILNAGEYYAKGMQNYANGMYLCHMNYRKGQGVIQTKPLPTPRKGAMYSLNFLVADNPDGGPLYKYIRVRVLVNDRLSSPTIAPIGVSSPFSRRDSLEWNRMSFYFVGTGEQTILQFESLTPGSYGAFVDNITVSLVSLIENGSFENTTGDLYASLLNISLPGDKVLNAPSSDIFGWTVTFGKVRYVNSDWYFPATDGSQFLIHLNAEFNAGTITSNPFITTPGKMYKVLFDTTAYPDDFPSVEGYIMASAFSQARNVLLASRSIFLSAKGYNLHNLGWTTYVLEFTALDTESFVEFASQMQGSFNGPFLDNVDIFEVSQLGHYTSVPLTFNGGRPCLMPSSWTTSLTIALAMWVFEHLMFEKLCLYG